MMGDTSCSFSQWATGRAALMMGDTSCSFSERATGLAAFMMTRPAASGYIRAISAPASLTHLFQQQYHNRNKRRQKKEKARRRGKTQREQKMPRRASGKGKGKAKEEGGASGWPRNAAYQDLFVPRGAIPPMCLCGDSCRLVRSWEITTLKRRYWKCRNYAFDPPKKSLNNRQMSPPPLCEFEQWFDMEINPEDQRLLDQANRDEELRRQLQEQREAARDEARRKEAEEKEAERERKRERARRAREAPPEAWEKGKWPRCTQ